jgi:hypothetical protein
MDILSSKKCIPFHRSNVEKQHLKNCAFYACRSRVVPIVYKYRKLHVCMYASAFCVDTKMTARQRETLTRNIFALPYPVTITHQDFEAVAFVRLYVCTETQGGEHIWRSLVSCR